MQLCWAKYLLWLVISLAGAAAMLSGCGQDGNLYLPDEQQPKDPDDDEFL
jgi:predicted small lipoprotein YifL